MSVLNSSAIGLLLWVIISVICGVTPGAILTEEVNGAKAANNGAVTNQSEEEGLTENKEDFSSHDALERLSKLFGISRIPENFHHRTPPDYMLELYSRVAYEDGITKKSVPYDADVVRAIPDKALHQQILYHFNVSYIDPADQILQAEFHLYKISPQQRASKREQPTDNPPEPTNNPQQLDQNTEQPTDNSQQPTDHLDQPTDNPQQPTDNPHQPVRNLQQSVKNKDQPANSQLEPASRNVNRKRLNRQGSNQRNAHVLELRLYQILDPDRLGDKTSQKLLHQRRVSTYDRGWEIFKVKETVEQWVSQGEVNHGFLIETSSLHSKEDGELLLRFAQKSEHHDSKQPLLVVFTEEMKAQMEEEQEQESGVVPDNTPVAEDEIIEEVPVDEEKVLTPEEPEEAGEVPISVEFETESQPSEPAHNESAVTDLSSLRRKYIQFLNEKHREEHGTFPNIQTFSFMSPEQHKALVSGQLTQPQSSPETRRKRRAAEYSHRHHRKRKKVCSLHELYVDFDKIGWSSWIISPKGYDAFHCKGLCPFPLGQNQQPTNHATVQSIVHALGAGKDVGTPCCVPNKLFSISLLYFDDQENVILKQYDDMVATSCGCH